MEDLLVQIQRPFGLELRVCAWQLAELFLWTLTCLLSTRLWAACPRRIISSSSVHCVLCLTPGMNARAASNNSTHLPPSKSSIRFATSSRPTEPTLHRHEAEQFPRTDFSIDISRQLCSTPLSRCNLPTLPQPAPEETRARLQHGHPSQQTL